MTDTLFADLVLRYMGRVKEFDPSQARDEKGQWTNEGGGASNGGELSGGGESSSDGRKIIVKDVQKSIDNVRQKTRMDKKEHATMLDAEGNHVGNFDGKGTSVSVPADQWIKGGIFVHSHPGDVSFSPDDLCIAAANDSKGWIVAGTRHTFVIERNGPVKQFSIPKARKEWMKYLRETDSMTRDIKDFDEMEYISTDYASGKLARAMGFTYSSK